MRSITASRAEAFPIGQLAKRSGVKIETIRYYERVKMLVAPPRTASGRRVYHVADLRTLVFIRRSRELGFSLDEIRTLLRLGGPEKATCREVREIAATASGRHSGENRRPEKAGTALVENCCAMLRQDSAGVPSVGRSGYSAVQVGGFDSGDTMVRRQAPKNRLVSFSRTEASHFQGQGSAARPRRP